MDHVLIPFSGGVDSFYAALVELNSNNRVDLHYVALLNNATKIAVEQPLAAHHADTLRRYGDARYRDQGISLDTSELRVYPLLQPVMWLVFGNRGGVDYDRLVMGVIMGDDIISWRSETDALLTALGGLQYSPIKQGLDWRHIKTTKNMVYDFVKLMNVYPGVQVWENFWTCEIPLKITEASPKTLSLPWIHPNPNVPDLWTNTRTNTLIYRNGKALYFECGQCPKCQEESIRRRKNPSLLAPATIKGS